MRAGQRSRILVVDGEPTVRAALSTALCSDGWEYAECAKGADAYVRLRRERFDVVVSDVAIGGIDGLDLLELASALRDGPKVVLLSAESDAQRVRRAFKCGAFDVLPKPCSTDEIRSAVAAALEERNREVAQVGNTGRCRASIDGECDAGAGLLPRRAFADALVAAVEAKEPHMRAHSLTVSHYCEELARRMGFAPRKIETLKTAALLHDIGKIGVPDAILQKPGPLTHEEFETVKRHPQTALQILRQSSFLNDGLSYILHHHEHYNGAGYPAGLAGDDIPFGARLLSLCDSLDAMLSARSYKQRLTVENAKSELARCAGEQFDPQAARAMLDWIDAQPHALVIR